MTRLIPTRAAAVAGALALAAALAGCGKMGDLQRPQPLFGKPRAAAAGNAQAAQGQDPSRPVNTIDPRDEFLNPAPSRSVQIPGQSPDPTAPSPQGALPDPYKNPQ